MATSCRQLAASDRSLLPRLSYDEAKGMAGAPVSTCAVPKAGLDGEPRLNVSQADALHDDRWVRALSLDQPLPGGMSVSRSYDLYVNVDGGWVTARMAGVSGTS